MAGREYHLREDLDDEPAHGLGHRLSARRTATVASVAANGRLLHHC